jgi:dolichol-phosphate mannosyltransferase
MTERLAVVAPVYNEASAIAPVLASWLPCLRATGAAVTVYAIDDGSTDGSGELLDELARDHSELVVIRQPNAGHGRACLRGYRSALADGAHWVLQIDTDGQCDPSYFASMWRLRDGHRAVYGYRARRDDGVHRLLISRAVSLLVLATMHVWVRDPNVPYRLIHRDLLARDLCRLADDTPLPNVALAALHADEIAWVPIRFLRRTAGVSHRSFVAMARLAPSLARGLRDVRARRGAAL